MNYVLMFNVIRWDRLKPVLITTNKFFDKVNDGKDDYKLSPESLIVFDVDNPDDVFIEINKLIDIENRKESLEGPIAINYILFFENHNWLPYKGNSKS